MFSVYGVGNTRTLFPAERGVNYRLEKCHTEEAYL